MEDESLRFGNFTDTGRVREKNEDYYGTFETSQGTLFVVCDGMGGHRGGQIASRLAVETIKEFCISNIGADPEKTLSQAVLKANSTVYELSIEDPELEGMGTTIVALLINPDSPSDALICHVGDSRIYLVRNGKLSQLTRDHSMVWQMVEKGILTREEARDHPRKNVITRAVGLEMIVKPEIQGITLFKDDRLILCTDGITDLIDDPELLELSTEDNPQKCAEILVAEANKRGGVDNSTVQVIDVCTGQAVASESSILVFADRAFQSISDTLRSILFSEALQY